MAVKRFLSAFGMGRFLRRRDHTEAARRAVRDALRHNSISPAGLFGKDEDAMIVGIDAFRPKSG